MQSLPRHLLDHCTSLTSGVRAGVRPVPLKPSARTGSSDLLRRGGKSKKFPARSRGISRYPPFCV